MKVRIESGRIGTNTKVLFNEEIVKKITSLNLKIGLRSANQLEVTYLPESIEFEGEAEIIAVINNKKYKLIEGVL